MEDDQAVREIGARTLRSLGYNVCVAASGQEALSLVRESGVCPELLLTDAAMPGMDGKELAQAIRRLCPQVRVLFTSGHGQAVLGSLPSGDGFLQKPYSAGSLASAVRQLLDRTAG